MTLLVLAMVLSSAPGCPAALQHASALSDPDLALTAARLVESLETAGAGGPVGALREEAGRAARAERASLRDAGARFRAALQRHCTLSSHEALAGATSEERARAARILEQPAFRRARADPEAVRRWVLGLWARFLALLETDEAQRYATVSRGVFLLAAAAAAILGLLAILRRRPGGQRHSRAPEELPAPAADAGLDAAEAAAARGEATRAIRLAFLASLAALEHRGDVPPGRALTNRELIERLQGGEQVGRLPRPGPATLPAFELLSALFDRTVYGGRTAGPDEAAVALDAARTVKGEGTA